jgi:hypothetical protein
MIFGPSLAAIPAETPCRAGGLQVDGELKLSGRGQRASAPENPARVKAYLSSGDPIFSA